MGFLSELLTSLGFIPSIVSQPSAIARLLGYSCRSWGPAVSSYRCVDEVTDTESSCQCGVQVSVSWLCIGEKRLLNAELEMPCAVTEAK